jgi:heat-inducible transcriptional repressor
MDFRDINNRERQVLGIIIQAYVVTAAPVGSRYIAKNYNLGLSDATIRNVMAELESEGYISQPHTSAGRIPTDKGYRYYVDLIMTFQSLDEQEKKRIEEHVGDISIDRKGTSSDVLLSAVKVLGTISRQLSVVLSPTLSNAIFEKLDMVLLSSTRMMVILSIQSLLILRSPARRLTAWSICSTSVCRVLRLPKSAAQLPGVFRIAVATVV